MQKEFIERVVDKIKTDEKALGLAVAGSWITNEVDEYSDVDLIFVTTDRIFPDTVKMMGYAKSFGHFISGFTGEHIGDSRVLICMYDLPLLHVDIKFLTIDEFYKRVEDPVVVWEKNNALTNVISKTTSAWPKVDYQWIEDRFWTWIHYVVSKLGRGENFEALDFLSFIRTTVISPLLQVKNGKLPRGVRKVEFNFDKADLDRLTETIPVYSTVSLFSALENTVKLYCELRDSVCTESIISRKEMEIKTLDYLKKIKTTKLC